MTEHLLRRELRLEGSPKDVFPFFADAANLGRITPPELRFQITTPLPIEMRVGAIIEYQLRLFGVPFGWRTEISAWEPPYHFVDEQRRGPYALWHHTHRFEESEGATLMIDEVRYALPLSPLGEIAHPIVRRQLDRIFDYRAAMVPELVGG
ncbi:MAG: SRPBCC family protein [Myxococcota bacterium]